MPVPDLMCVGRGVCWEVEAEDEVEVEPDCPAESVGEASSCTKVPVVDLEVDQQTGQLPPGSGIGVGLVYCTVEDCRQPSTFIRQAFLPVSEPSRPRDGSCIGKESIE